MSENTLDIKRLIACREKIGISKNEAAKRIGISQPAYLRYESGERTPSPQVIKEIAIVLHTSADYLMGNCKSSKPTEITITKDADPELFELAEIYYQSDKKQQQRILHYMKKYFEG